MKPSLPEINQVALSGQLATDLESCRTTENRLKIRFTLAVNRSHRDHAGQWQQDRIHIPVIVWDKLAEYLSERLCKGSTVFVAGRLSSSACETENGMSTTLEVLARSIQILDKQQDQEEQNHCPTPAICG